jgi:putative membrane protein
MNQRYVVCFIGALLPALGAHADNLSAADRSFVAMVSQGGMFEVKAGQVGADQGNTQDIKDQGTTESHDHKLVGDKLKGIASANNIQIADSLNAGFQKNLDELKALSGHDNGIYQARTLQLVLSEIPLLNSKPEGVRTN